VIAVRVPASSANLGPGFDVLGMALDLCADVGTGEAPDAALQLDEHHPATIAFTALGGTGPLWIRCSIPMGRGLGFSGAARVGGAALAVVAGAADADAALHQRREEILDVATRLEGHGDNVSASLYGGIVASVGARPLALRVGPRFAAASVVAWIPDEVTSTDRSRAELPAAVERSDAVHNLERIVQFVLAVERDDPALLSGATADRLHQPQRLPAVTGASDALLAGTEAGAWCGWLSGSGPTVAFLCPGAASQMVIDAMPPGGHSKELHMDLAGARVIEAAVMDAAVMDGGG
jgi:homoserine kinase